MQTKTKKSLALNMEEKGPILLAVTSFILLIYYSPSIASMFKNDEWKSAGLYSAIFGWAAIQTGFAFGVYGFVVGKSDGFIGKISNTLAMRRFKIYISRANITGFILTVFSIPLIIVEPKLDIPNTAQYIIVSLWFSLFIWSFLSFLRMAYNFGHLTSVQDK